jgi:hypothetical protein
MATRITGNVAHGKGVPGNRQAFGTDMIYWFEIVCGGPLIK